MNTASLKLVVPGNKPTTLKRGDVVIINVMPSSSCLHVKRDGVGMLEIAGENKSGNFSLPVDLKSRDGLSVVREIAQAEGLDAKKSEGHDNNSLLYFEII